MRGVNFYKTFRSFGYDTACRWDKVYYSLHITELHLLGVNRHYKFVFKFKLRYDIFWQMLEWNIDPSIYKELMNTICGGRTVLDDNETNVMRNK